FAVEDVERRLVDVAVLLRPAARSVLLEVKMEHLRDAVLRLDIVPAVGLRSVDEPQLLSLPHAPHGAPPRALLAQAVLPLEGARGPAGGHRRDTRPVRTELLRERAVGQQPAADEVAAGLDRPLRVNRAAALAPEMARLPGLHLVPADIPRHPAIAARRAGSALAPRRLQHDHLPAALLVFLAAAAWKRIVSPDSHSAQ